MATSNTRDVELRIAAKASGSEQIQQLADQLLEMGKTAGAAAPEFDRLAQEVINLGKQASAAGAFRDLSVEVEKAAASLSDAKQQVLQLGERFAQETARMEQYKQTQADARAAVRQTGEALDEAKTKLQRYRADASAADRATVGYKNEVDKLKTSVRQLEDQLAQQKGMVDSKSAYNAAQRELDKLATTYAKAQSEVVRLEKELEQQNAKLEGGRKALLDLGVSVTNLAEVEQTLAKSAAATSEAIRLQTVYAGHLYTEMERAAQAERDLAAVNAIEAKRQEAIQLQKAAEYVNFWTQALNKAEAAEKQLALESQRAAQALNNAFSTTGIRSAREIENEIVQINQALRLMASSGQVSGKEFDRAFATAKERVTALERELKGLPPALQQSVSLSDVLRQSLSQLTAAFGAFQLGSGFITAANQFEMLRRSMTLITGDATTAGAQIEFLRDTANRTGLSVGVLAQDFINFSAAANTSGIALGRQREVFTAVANAAGQLGISTDRVGLILQALAQTANKGKVSLEELQGQLGESLPGALAIVSNGFGVTKEKLLEMVKAGVDGQAFFDAFARGVTTTFTNAEAKVVSFAAAWNRIKNALTEVSQQAADTAAFRALVSIMDSLAGNMKTVVDTTINLGQAFALIKIAEMVRGFLGLEAATARAALSTKEHAAAAVQDTVATVENTRATQLNAAAKGEQAVATGAAAKATQASAVAMVQADAAMARSSAAAVVATSAWARMGTAAAGVLTAMRGFLAVLGGPVGAAITIAIAFYDQLENAFVKLYGRISGTTAALEANEKKLAEIAKAEKDRADDFERDMARRAVAYRQVGELQDTEINKIKARGESLDRTSVAAQRDINLRIEQAKLAGDSIRVAELELQKAVEQQRQAENGAKATRDEIGALERKREAQIAAVGGYDKLNEAQRAQIKALDEQIKAAKEELPLAQQRAKLAAVEAEARKQAATEAAGQTTSLQSLKRAYEDSQAALEKAVKLEREGLVVGQDVTKMRTAAAAAEGAYNAALAKTLGTIGLTKEELTTGLSPAMLRLQNNTDDLRDALKGAGTEAGFMSTSLSKAFAKELEAANTQKALQSVIDRINAAKAAGDLFGAGLESAFKLAIDKAIALANTDKDLKRVEEQIKAITAANPQMAGAFADSLEKIKGKLLELDPVLRQVAADADLLGVKLQAASSKPVPTTEALIRAYERLKMSGKATAGEVQDAFTAMAEKVIKANGGVIPEWLKVEAAARQATISIDEAGRATVKFANDSVNALSTVEQRIGTLSSKYDELTKKQADSVNAKRNEGYDAQGFAKDTAGNRLTSGTYLPPPDNSGDWTWVPKLGDFTNYPYGGYWEKKTQGRGAQMGSTTQYTGANGIGYGRGFNVGPGVAGSLVNFSTPMGPGGVAGIGATPSASPSAAPSGGGQSYTVNVNIGGRATTINTASAADADALANLLKQLGDVAGRTGG